jgi:hypothetical protein
MSDVKISQLPAASTTYSGTEVGVVVQQGTTKKYNISRLAFEGTILTTDVPTLNQNTTGNAGTATKLQTARLINGVSFDGSADITLPNIITIGATEVKSGTSNYLLSVSNKGELSEVNPTTFVATQNGQIGDGTDSSKLYWWDDINSGYDGQVYYNGGSFYFVNLDLVTPATLDAKLAASNVTGLATVATSGKFSDLSGPTTIGSAFVTLTNPSAVGFVRTNADNTVTARTPVQVRDDLGYLTPITLTTTGAVSIDPSTGTRFILSLTGNVTLSVTGDVEGSSFTLRVNGQSSGYTVTWSITGLKWATNAAPTLPTVSGQFLLLTFIRWGTNDWSGAISEVFS